MIRSLRSRFKQLKHGDVVRSCNFLQLLKETYCRLQGTNSLLQIIVISYLNAHQTPHTVDACHQIVHLTLRDLALDLFGHVSNHRVRRGALDINASIVVVRQKPSGKSAPHDVQISRNFIQLHNNNNKIH
jgi:hypothetical protein